jgi:hypothetical protein
LVGFSSDAKLPSEIVGDGVSVEAADLEGDGELPHNANQFGFGDGRGQNGEHGEVVGMVGRFAGADGGSAKSPPVPWARRGRQRKSEAAARDSFMAAPEELNGSEKKRMTGWLSFSFSN